VVAERIGIGFNESLSSQRVMEKLMNRSKIDDDGLEQDGGIVSVVLPCGDRAWRIVQSHDGVNGLDERY
jgi:hypothetical protein